MHLHGSRARRPGPARVRARRRALAHPQAHLRSRTGSTGSTGSVRTIWLTWRQHRKQALWTAIALAVLAAAL
ncbi:hypothetical protein ACWC5I_42625, partial [Kitasatospora sp. NPDC001574]